MNTNSRFWFWLCSLFAALCICFTISPKSAWAADFDVFRNGTPTVTFGAISSGSSSYTFSTSNIDKYVYYPGDTGSSLVLSDYIRSFGYDYGFAFQPVTSWDSFNFSPAAAAPFNFSASVDFPFTVQVPIQENKTDFAISFDPDVAFSPSSFFVSGGSGKTFLGGYIVPAQGRFKDATITVTYSDGLSDTVSFADSELLSASFEYMSLDDSSGQYIMSSDTFYLKTTSVFPEPGLGYFEVSDSPISLSKVSNSTSISSISISGVYNIPQTSLFSLTSLSGLSYPLSAIPISAITNYIILNATSSVPISSDATSGNFYLTVLFNYGLSVGYSDMDFLAQIAASCRALSHQVSRIPSLIRSALVPTSEQISEAFEDFNDQVKDAGSVGEMVSVVHDDTKAFIDALQDPDEGSIVLPALEVNINGTKYKLWDDFDLKPFLKNEPVQQIITPAAVILEYFLAFYFLKHLYYMYLCIMGGYSYSEFITSLTAYNNESDKEDGKK